MKLLRTEPQALSAALHAQVDTLLHKAFDLPGPYDYGPDRPEVVLPLDDDGRVIGHAATYRRPISIGDETVTVGMIGGVAIDPAERGRGHVRTMVARSIASSRPKPCPSRCCSPSCRRSIARAATAR